MFLYSLHHRTTSFLGKIVKAEKWRNLVQVKLNLVANNSKFVKISNFRDIYIWDKDIHI